MSSRLLALWLALALVLVLLLDDAQGAKGRGGKRGRGRMRSSGSARYIFYTHPKRKEYYDNPNVSRHQGDTRGRRVAIQRLA